MITLFGLLTHLVRVRSTTIATTEYWPSRKRSTYCGSHEPLWKTHRQHWAEIHGKATPNPWDGSFHLFNVPYSPHSHSIRQKHNGERVQLACLLTGMAIFLPFATGQSRNWNCFYIFYCLLPLPSSLPIWYWAMVNIFPKKTQFYSIDIWDTIERLRKINFDIVHIFFYYIIQAPFILLGL